MHRKIFITFIILLFIINSTVDILAEDGDLFNQIFAPVVLYQPICHIIINPGQSIQAVINNAHSNQVICVRSGTYHEQINISPSQSGITLMGYPGDIPIIDGRDSLPNDTSISQYRGLVHISGSNVIFDSFHVKDSSFLGLTIYQPSSAEPPLQNVIVRNSIVSGSMDSGIVVDGFGEVHPRHILIENNIIHSNLRKNADVWTGGTGVVFVEVDESVARGNHVYNNLGEGLVADRWSNQIVFENNVVYDNSHANLYLVNTQNPLVQRNLVFCTDDRAYWFGQGNTTRPGDGIQVGDESFPGLGTKPPPSSGQVIINNIVVGCGTNFGVASQIPGGGLNNAVVANNSFINARGDNGDYVNNVKFDGQASYANSQFVNNLIMQSGPGGVAAILTFSATPDLSTFHIANNLYSSLPISNHNWPTSEPNRLIADPGLFNPLLPVKGVMPDARNYSLVSTSPAIDAGRVNNHIIEDFFQLHRTGAPDIGAIEFSN